ncbi:MAG TPA: nucleotide sugar dehydrogenase [Acidimicrobiales bacterium]|nr:nucleotide sugar dehydrogenase [Acidimicrobiales bacterium]
MDDAKPIRIVVAGQGYVGLPLAIRAVEVGFDVVGYDTDPRRIQQLAQGYSYVEDIRPARVADALRTGRYLPTTSADDLAGFDIAVITVPTPLTNGAPDLSCIEQAARTVGGHLRPGTLVVLESTTYPGTTEEVVGPLLESASGLRAGADFRLGYSPERIDPGNPDWALVNTPKVVSGMDDRSRQSVQRFYDSLVDTTVPVTGTREAELAKLLENTFRQVNIALVNELAMFANGLGIDIWEAIDAAATKPFGFMSFRPGPGVGGHCLPIDPRYLAWHTQQTLGLRFRFVELASDINEHMPDYVVHRLVLALNTRRLPVNGTRVLLLGLAYKKNTGDVRESPALQIAHRLLDLGADVAYADPFITDDAVIDPRLSRVPLDRHQIDGADAVVVLADHDDFDLDLVAGTAKYVLDTRHRLPAGPDVEYL